MAELQKYKIQFNYQGVEMLVIFQDYTAFSDTLNVGALFHYPK